MASQHRVRSAVFALACGLFTVSFAGTTVRAAVAVGDAPAFSVTALDGSTLSLAQYKGKLVLVDFWATWCGPCMGEAAHMVAIHDKYADKGLQFVGISLDQDKDELKKVIAEKKFNWPQFFDGQGWKNKLAKEWGVNSIPRTFLVDPAGKVVWSGHPANVDAAIEKAFKDSPPALVDAATMSSAVAALDLVDKNLDADPVTAIKALADVPAAAQKDPDLAARITAAHAKAAAASEKLMAGVESQIAAKDYGGAIKQLRVVAAKLDKQPIGVRAQKRLDELMTRPETKAQMQALELAARADEMLASAVRLKDANKSEQAYLAYKQVVKQFSNTPAAKTAMDVVATYEQDPKFVRRALDLQAGEQAKSLMSLASSYKSMKKYEQARAKYQQIVNDYPGTSYAELAKGELAGL